MRYTRDNQSPLIIPDGFELYMKRSFDVKPPHELIGWAVFRKMEKILSEKGKEIIQPIKHTLDGVVVGIAHFHSLDDYSTITMSGNKGCNLSLKEGLQISFGDYIKVSGDICAVENKKESLQFAENAILLIHQKGK